MSCQRCQSPRLLKACGKTSDMCCLNFQGRVYDGYVPRNVNLGGGDYLDVQICLECGQAQGRWPVANAALPDELSVGCLCTDDMCGQPETCNPDCSYCLENAPPAKDAGCTTCGATPGKECQPDCDGSGKLRWENLRPENGHGAGDGFGGEDYPSGHPIAHRTPCCANEDRDMRGGCRSCGDPCL